MKTTCSKKYSYTPLHHLHFRQAINIVQVFENIAFKWKETEQALLSQRDRATEWVSSQFSLSFSSPS